jgi:hypothetical protein
MPPYRTIPSNEEPEILNLKEKSQYIHPQAKNGEKERLRMI